MIVGLFGSWPNINSLQWVALRHELQVRRSCAGRVKLCVLPTNMPKTTEDTLRDLANSLGIATTVKTDFLAVAELTFGCGGQNPGSSYLDILRTHAHAHYWIDRQGRSWQYSAIDNNYTSMGFTCRHLA